jgi:putative transcriptional regulator
MSEHPEPGLAEAYALGALEPAERGRLEAHLSSCPACREAAGRLAEAVAALPESLAPRPPAAALKERLLALAEAPRGPLDLGAYAWDEPLPGVRMHVLKRDPARDTRSVLVWARPGARVPRHRHLGTEDILVLQGGLRDHRGEYHAGDVCRSAAGSVHAEEALPGEDCVCFVVYWGGHEMLE